MSKKSNIANENSTLKRDTEDYATQLMTAKQRACFSGN